MRIQRVNDLDDDNIIESSFKNCHDSRAAGGGGDKLRTPPDWKNFKAL